jgi:soluble lytic murein transglycosylase-like protein
MKKRSFRLLIFFVFFLILIYNPISARIFTYCTAVFFKLNVRNYYHLIAVESSFKSLAFSRQKAIGLGQVKASTANYIQPNSGSYLVWFPPTNLYISAKYMKYLLRKYKQNWSLALAAYNWGETNVDKRIGKMKIDSEKNYRQLFSDIPETYHYIKKVLPQ